MMNIIEQGKWEAEMETIISEFSERGLLSDELREEVESLLERDCYEKAGRIVVNNVSDSKVYVD